MIYADCTFRKCGLRAAVFLAHSDVEDYDCACWDHFDKLIRPGTEVVFLDG